MVGGDDKAPKKNAQQAPPCCPGSRAVKRGKERGGLAAAGALSAEKDAAASKGVQHSTVAGWKK